MKLVTSRTAWYFPVLIGILTMAALLMAGCSKQEVGFETLETARSQARSNADFNAKKWRADTKVWADASIISKGDSSQTPSCPQGDGWATLEIVNSVGTSIGSLKCSTVSLSIGCRESKDFKSSPYANDDGQCQPVAKVPHPIPKLVQ